MPDVDRAALIASLEEEGFFVTEWTDDAGRTYAPHAHERREVRVVLQGSMTVVTGGRARTIGPGERVDLAPGQVHETTIGRGGVRYLAGTLPGGVGGGR